LIFYLKNKKIAPRTTFWGTEG